MPLITDISQPLIWVARKGNNNPATITVTESAAAFNISSYTFALYVFNVGDNYNVLGNAVITLTQGSGLTNGGATGILTAQITAAQTASLNADDYFWVLRVTTGGLVNDWMQGKFQLNDGAWEGSTTSGITVAVDLGANNVSVALNLGSGGGSGDVVGPASAVDDRIVTFDGTTGKLIQDGGSTIAGITALIPSLTNVQLYVPLSVTVSASQAITNQPSAEAFLISSSRHVTKIDGTKYSECRMIAHIITGSASVNTPRLYPKWKDTSFDPASTVVGDFTTLGTGLTTNACSLASIAFVATDWITLPAGAKADVWWCCAQIGGDANADPAYSVVALEFRV